MAEVAYVPGEGAPFERRPTLGYAMVAAAAALFAVNGAVSKVVLVSSGMSALRLAEARCTGALVGIGLVLLALRPASLQTSKREIALLGLYGLVGVALVQLFYFLAIRRLEIGVSLLIQYLGPVLVVVWARFVIKERMRRRIWIALAMALLGLSLVVNVWRGVPLDGLGVLYSSLAAVMFAAALLLGEHAVGSRDPLSLLCFGFLVASLFWAIVQPWWSFPVEEARSSISLLGNLEDVSLPTWSLIAWIVVAGTIVPFVLIVGSLRHLPATRVGIVAMLEPVLGAIVAFVWLDETLGTAQLVGGAIVLAGILLAQTAR
jgi:drug/metabolite transporter (DMT)-like permease